MTQGSPATACTAASARSMNSACCVYGLTFTSHFYGARRSVGYVPFNSESLVTGKLYEDIREAVRQVADPANFDAVVVINLCVPTASGVPLQMLPREIDGVRIPQGTAIDLVLASANRDPRKFEDPDRFNIFRERKHRHVAFASGPHLCIGQHLAKVEMTRALNALLDKLPGLRLDPDQPAPQMIGHLLRSPEHLWVRFDA
jgi:hypothetical protein